MWACDLWISQGPMCTPSAVLKPRFFVSSRRNDIFSSTKLHVSQTRLTPVPAEVMHAPFSGLSGVPSAPTTVSGMMPSRLRRLLADDRLEGDLRQPRREVLRREEVEQRRVASRPCRPRSCRRSAMLVMSATARVLAMIRSKVPWPPRSGRERLCASRSPSSVILMPFRPSGLQPLDHLAREQQPVRDDVDHQLDAAPGAGARAAARRGSRGPACSAAARRRRR